MASQLDILHRGRGDTAVLLFHGLLGIPAELRALANALAGDGHTVYAPLLPGRGTRAEDMYGLSWEDWMAAALEAYDELARDHRYVVVGGQSAGGTMALDVALRRDPAALLLYATALGIGPRGAYLAPLVWRFIRCWPAPPSDLVDSEGECVTYDPAPVRPVSELIWAIRRIRPRLREIDAPALIAHAVSDKFVPLRCAQELATALRGHVETLFLSDTGHAITADAKRHEVVAASRRFLGQCFQQAELRSA
ncbi:MAG TPA: alpha/beta fold hydrolase [Candidatus Limnocylindria bacterium]|nr:alpha/beta fold hydrolase [Candidatus Limnocylindria bacterium]